MFISIASAWKVKYSQRHNMMHHCDRHITHFGDLDVFSKFTYLRPRKKICVSDRPTDLKILLLTLTFFMPKKKSISKIRKFVSVSVFVSDLTIFFISLYIWSMFGTSIISGVEMKNGDLEYTQVITRTLYCMSNN